MKKFLFMAMAAIAALSSCSNNDEFEQTQIGNQGLVFTATMEGSEGTRATYDATNKCALWEAGDKISINGVSYSATPDGTDATKATFTKVSEASNPTPTYKAYFPASLYNGTTATLPAIQTYTAGKFNMPMYATSTTTSLVFKNLCAVLAIKVTNADIPTLKSIKVKSDKKLNGSFTVTSTTDGGYKAVIGTNGSNEVVLSMGETPIDPTTDGTTFYIAIPAQEYSYLKIYLSEDGTHYKRAMITKKASGLGEIARNKIYNIAYETNAVQMYENSPYWSTMNVGATTVAGSYTTCYGDLYEWGSVETIYNKRPWTSATAGSFDGKWKEGKGSGYSWTTYCGSSSFVEWDTAPYDATTKILKSEKDAATQNWGTGWRMPTSEEFQALYEACGKTGTSCTPTAKGSTSTAATGIYRCSDYDGVVGLLFITKDKGPHLFFPAAGFGHGATYNDSAGSYGGYWSSSLSTYTSNARYLYFIITDNSNNVYPQYGDYRFRGRSVPSQINKASFPKAIRPQES